MARSIYDPLYGMQNRTAFSPTSNPGGLPLNTGGQPFPPTGDPAGLPRQPQQDPFERLMRDPLFNVSLSLMQAGTPRPQRVGLGDSIASGLQRAADFRTAGEGSKERWGVTPVPYKKPDGSTAYGVVSNMGNFKPVSGNIVKYTWKDVGDEHILVDESGQTMARLPKNLSEEDKLEHLREVAEQTNDLALKHELRKAEETHVRSLGYARESMISEAETTSKIESKRQREEDIAQEPSARSAVINMREEVGQITDTIDGMLNDINTGVVEPGLWAPGKVFASQPYADFAAKLTFIAGKVALERLEALKATGATMGSLSENELALLKASSGPLTIKSSGDLLSRTLNNIKNGYQRLLGTWEVAYQTKYEQTVEDGQSIENMLMEGY